VTFNVTTGGNFKAANFYAGAPGLQFMAIFVGMAMESRAIWIFCLLSIAAMAIVAWLQALKRKRMIGDTPTSKIVSAAQGYVELQGVGRPFPDNPVRSPLTGLPCLWFRYTLEEKDADGEWKAIQHSESEVSFILDDGTGQCLIDPEGAEIIAHRCEKSTRYGQRATEWKLIERDTLYTLGEFKTFGGHHLELDPREDLKALLADWKKDPVALQQKFDLDSDGKLSEQEWELARAAAKRQVSKQHREARQQADSHVLRKPGDGRNYLISGTRPDQLARRFTLWCAFHLLVFFGALASIPWVWWNFD
jgi:hypothetical protein